MSVYAVANLKGGTAKTTTAAYLAHALSGDGPVLAVDADPPASLLAWSETAAWDVHVVAMPSTDMHRRLDRLSRDYRHVVIDTPPLDERAGIVNSALRSADAVLVPVAPSRIEVERLPPILDAATELEPLLDRPLPVRVVLTRAVRHTNAVKDARAVLDEAGVSVLPTLIPFLQRYAQAFGERLDLDEDDPYQLMTTDLQESIR